MALPQIIVQVAFTTDPLDPAPSWTTISTYTDGYDISIGKQAELDAYQPGTASLVLKNDDRRFDPTHATGPYYGNLNPRKLLRIQAVWAGVTYDLFYGFVDGWNQKPNRLGAATLPITCTDLFGILANIELPSSVYALEVAADSPKAWWRLNEVAGTEMTDSSGHYDGKYLTGTTALSSGAIGEWESEPGLNLDGEHWGHVEDQTVLLTTSSPLTVEAVIRIPTDAAPAVASRYRIYMQGTGDGNALAANSLTFGVVESGGGLYLEYGTRDLSNRAALGVNLMDGEPHHIAVRRAASTTFYVDGVAATTTISGFFPSIASGAYIGGYDGGSGGGSNQGAAWPWELADVAIYDFDIGATRIADHANALLNPWGGEDTGARVARVAQDVGLTSAQYNTDTGMSTIGSAILTGSALDHLRFVEDTEQGALYIDHADSGTLRFANRHNRLTATRSTTVQFTFTDEDTPSTIHVERGSIEVLWDWQLIYNEVTVTFMGGGSVTVSDATSIASYGRRSLPLDTGLQTAAEARNLAEWVLSHYKDPIARINSLELNPAGDDTSAAAALGLRLGDRVEVKLKPQNVGVRQTFTLIVEGKQHTFDKASGEWRTTLYLSPAETKVYGIWGSGLWGTDLWGY